MMTPFQAGEMFFALRLHFTRESYDYFKYHGKTTINPKTFELRSDKFIFAKLTRLYRTPEEYRDLVVANCLHDPHVYSRMLLSSDAQACYLAYRKIHESFSYVVEQDIQRLFEERGDINWWLRADGEFPPLLRAVWTQRITMETLLAMNRVCEFLPFWERTIRDTIRTPAFLSRCRKYDPFVTVDVPKTKTLLRKWVAQPTI